MPINDRMRQVRLLLKLSQPAIAKLTGVSRGTWQNYESGPTSPAADALLALAGRRRPLAHYRRGDTPLIDGARGEVDEELLANCIQALEELLYERGLTLSPENMASAILLTYRLCAENGEIDREELNRIVTLAA